MNESMCVQSSGSKGRRLQSFLPELKGPFTIGTRTVPIIDPSRVDFTAADTGRPRRVLVQLWYPATTSGRLSPLIDDPALPSALATSLELPPILDFLHSLGCHAHPGAPPAPGPHPLLIFLSGMAGFRQSNLFQIEHLVSHGYVVAGIDVPGFSATVKFPDGTRIAALPAEISADLVVQSISPQKKAPRLDDREYPEGIIAELTQDVSAVIDSLERPVEAGVLDAIDLTRIGAFGVSLGGITTAEVLRTDTRVKAGLMMDSPAPTTVAEAGLVDPAMWVTRDATSMRNERALFGGWSEVEIDTHQGSISTAVSRTPRGWRLDLNEFVHLDFTGAPYGSPALQRMASGPLGGPRAHRILNTLTKAFFDHALRGSAATTMFEAATSLPEVAVVNRPTSG